MKKIVLAALMLFCLASFTNAQQPSKPAKKGGCLCLIGERCICGPDCNCAVRQVPAQPLVIPVQPVAPVVVVPVAPLPYQWGQTWHYNLAQRRLAAYHYHTILARRPMPVVVPVTPAVIVPVVPIPPK